jgi:hypothetical protein
MERYGLYEWNELHVWENMIWINLTSWREFDDMVILMTWLKFGNMDEINNINNMNYILKRMIIRMTLL